VWACTNPSRCAAHTPAHGLQGKASGREGHSGDPRPAGGPHLPTAGRGPRETEAAGVLRRALGGGPLSAHGCHVVTMDPTHHRPVPHRRRRAQGHAPRLPRVALRSSPVGLRPSHRAGWSAPTWDAGRQGRSPGGSVRPSPPRRGTPPDGPSPTPQRKRTAPRDPG
jgi:hypothetical protein